MASAPKSVELHLVPYGLLETAQWEAKDSNPDGPNEHIAFYTPY